MKKLPPLLLGLFIIVATLQVYAPPALAQDTSAPIAQSPDVPTAIVVQSISSQSNAIEWVILIQIVAFLVVLTLLMNGTVQDKLRLRWRSDRSDSAESPPSTD